MEESFNLLAFIWTWFKIICFGIGVANLATFLFPSTSNVPIVQGGKDILNIAALNVRKNKNKDDPR